MDIGGYQLWKLFIRRVKNEKFSKSKRAPKQIADAMGHDLNTHHNSYARFTVKDLEQAFDSFDLAEV